MSFIWGFNNGEQLKVTVIIKYVYVQFLNYHLSGFKGFIMQIYFELQHFKKFIQTFLCNHLLKAAPYSKLQNFERQKHYNNSWDLL